MIHVLSTKDEYDDSIADSSTEWYTDTHGTDLTQFLIETLNKNPKDRVFMFKVEIDLVNLAKDPR